MGVCSANCKCKIHWKNEEPGESMWPEQSCALPIWDGSPLLWTPSSLDRSHLRRRCSRHVVPLSSWGFSWTASSPAGWPCFPNSNLSTSNQTFLCVPLLIWIWSRIATGQSPAASYWLSYLQSSHSRNFLIPCIIHGQQYRVKKKARKKEAVCTTLFSTLVYWDWFCNKLASTTRSWFPLILS